MNLKNFRDSLISLIFLGLLGIYLYNHYLRPSPLAIFSSSKIIKANDILKQKTIIADSLLNTAATSTACVIFLKHSAELSMNNFVNEFIDHKMDSIYQNCTGALPNALQQKIKKNHLECVGSLRNKISRKCYASLIKTKSSSVSIIIREDADPLELSAPLLLHLIADHFESGELVLKPERSLLIIDALIKLEPLYFEVYKIKLLLLSMSSLALEDKNKLLFQSTLAEANKINPADQELREIALAEQGGLFLGPNFLEDEGKTNKSKAFIKYLNNQSDINPNDIIFDYYKAYALYNENNKHYDEVLVMIENLLKKNPQNERLIQTLSNLKSEDEQKRFHPFIVPTTFSLDDL